MVGSGMKKRKAPETTPEAQTANATGEARREKEKQARQRNAEKQKRFRESMKAGGFRRVTLWDLPSPADKRMAGKDFKQVPAWEAPKTNTDKSRAVKIKLAVQIRESSLHIAARQPEIQAALKSAAGSFLRELGGGELSKEKQAVYSDFMELLKPLGDPWAGD